MFRIAVVGTGHWGPNIARSFELSGRAQVAWLCDPDAGRLEIVGSRYPDAKRSESLEPALDDPAVDAIAISTPVRHHHALASRALEAGKHVLVEKPMTGTSDDARSLIRLAEKQNRILMVGHVFQYNASLRALKALIDSGELGDIHYLDFERTNLGPVRTDVNALWDLASHDVSILFDLFSATPKDVSARGQSFLNSGIEDAVFSTWSFENGPLAHIHASWLNPRKVRRITVVGNQRMAIWDDLDLEAPIRIFNKTVVLPDGVLDTFVAHKTAVVDGGVTIPKVALNAPLQAECEHFLDCIESGATPRSDGVSGLRVVLALEAATESMRNESRLIRVPPLDEPR